MAAVHRVAAAVLVLATASVSSAAWPARLFAPYLFLGSADQFQMTAAADAIGQKYYTLAFVIADRKTRSHPTWYGQVPLDRGLYADQIDAIRRRGGDVICSFGGEDGVELAIAVTDAAALEAQYQDVIDRYHFTWLDFDIEGSNLTKHPDASRRRNAVLTRLQKKNPGLRVSYTLPADPNGVGEESLALLADAKAQCVSVYSANLMVMYFGHALIGHGRTEGELGIDSAVATHKQLRSIDADICIGLCPCVGVNGNKDEIFDRHDANALLAFAEKTEWVCSLSFWSINRDGMSGRGDDTTTGIAQKPFDFANAFKAFTRP